MISNLVPKSIKNNFLNRLKKRFRLKTTNEFYIDYSKDFFEKRKAIEQEIPALDLKQEHIKRLKVLLNREALLMQLPTNSVCAEIGVNEGEFSELIIKITNPDKLHLIDAWGNPERYHDGLRLDVEEKFRKEIETGKVEINVGFSTTVLSNMADNYFDWVYLDTDHSYKVTAAELDILKDKVKPGGIISGHDYIIGNWVGNIRYGVIEAVHEFCINNDWELIYITINKNEMPSFAIRKIFQNS